VPGHTAEGTLNSPLPVPSLPPATGGDALRLVVREIEQIPADPESAPCGTAA
jgi:hypothetical protein